MERIGLATIDDGYWPEDDGQCRWCNQWVVGFAKDHKADCPEDGMDELLERGPQEES